MWLLFLGLNKYLVNLEMGKVCFGSEIGRFENMVFTFGLWCYKYIIGPITLVKAHSR